MAKLCKLPVNSRKIFPLMTQVSRYHLTGIIFSIIGVKGGFATSFRDRAYETGSDEHNRDTTHSLHSRAYRGGGSSRSSRGFSFDVPEAQSPTLMI